MCAIEDVYAYCLLILLFGVLQVRHTARARVYLDSLTRVARLLTHVLSLGDGGDDANRT